MIYGIDISDYQPKIDAPNLKKGGVDFAFVKATDGVGQMKYFTQNAQQLIDADIITGAYHWFQPFMAVQSQLDALKRAVGNLNIRVVALDLEQCGLSYRNEAPIKEPKELSASAHQMIDGIRKMGVKPLLYSRSTFIWASASPIIEWIHEVDLWWASYPFHPSSVIQMSWNTLKTTYTPSGFRPYFVSGWPTDPKKRNVKFWQFTGDRFALPYVYNYRGEISPSDVNLFDGDLPALRSFLNLAPVVVGPTLEEKVELMYKSWLSHPELH